MSTAIGKICWAIAEGYIPVDSTGSTTQMPKRNPNRQSIPIRPN